MSCCSLKSLQNLPPGLKNLDASSNRLFSKRGDLLTGLPRTLERLSLANNFISEIEALRPMGKAFVEGDLMWLDLSGNPVCEC